MVFCFSDAHLDDLRCSAKEYQERDLSFMEQYVQDNYFSHDAIENHFECLLATPTDAMNGRDYVAYDKAIQEPFSFKNFFSELHDTPEANIFKNLLDLYLDLPIRLHSDIPDLSKMDSMNQLWMNKMFPNYNPNMTLRELMKGASAYSSGLLTDDKEVTKLRRYIAVYMNRDTYSFERWGVKFNSKFKETAIGKTFLETVESLLTENQKKDRHLRFIYSYNLLELYNITQERSSKGIKKFNMSSLSTDASHSYFGSFCDYLISNDKGMQVKANIVYQLYGVQTKVLSPDDFISLSGQLLRQEDTYATFLKSLAFDLKHAFLLKQNTDIESGIHTFNFKTTHTYFNYFNRLQIIKDNSQTIYALYCDRNFDANFFMFREVDVLVNKIELVLGIDNDMKGGYNWGIDDKSQIGDVIRRWNTNELVFTLTTSAKAFGNFIVLMIEMKDSSVLNF